MDLAVAARIGAADALERRVVAAAVDDAGRKIDEAVVARVHPVVHPGLEDVEVPFAAHVVRLHVVQPVEEAREPAQLRVLGLADRARVGAKVDVGEEGVLAALAPPLDSRRPSVPLIPVAAWTQRRGEAAMRWTAARRGSCALAPPSTRGARPSPLVSSLPGQRRGERLCAGAASRLEASVRRLSSHRRLDSGVARRLCAGATSRLEASVRCLSSPSPPVQRRGEQLCVGRRRG